MATESELAVGIVGFGISGSVFHAPLVSSTPGLRLAAIATSSPERQARAGARYPDARLYGDVEEFFADAPGLDLVVVGVTNDLHAEYALRLMRAGVAVVVEKPLAPSSAEAAAVVTEARRLGAFFTVFQNRRWDGDFLSVRQVVESGRVGPVVRLVSRFQWPQLDVAPGWREDPAPGLGGGVLLDLGVHLVDQALTLFGEVREVYAELAVRRRGAGIDDDSFVSLLFASGVRVHLGLSKVDAGPEARFHVVGLDGTYTTHGLDPQEGQLGRGVDPGDPGYGLGSPANLAELASRDGTVSEPVLAGAYPAYYRAVRDALRTGGAPPVDPADSVRALRVLEAAQTSARERTVVTFADGWSRDPV